MINCHLCSAAGELGGVLLPEVDEQLLELVLMSRGGKGDDCQGFEEFGIRTRCDKFYIKISVPRDVVDEGADNNESWLEFAFPEVCETADVVEPNLVLVLELSAGHFLGLDVGDHVHGVDELPSSGCHLEA